MVPWICSMHVSPSELRRFAAVRPWQLNRGRWRLSSASPQHPHGEGLLQHHDRDVSVRVLVQTAERTRCGQVRCRLLFAPVPGLWRDDRCV